MNTSLPILPGTGAVPKTLQGISDNIPVNQHDMTDEGKFGALLGDFHAALSESNSPVLPGEAIAGELMAELQELPEGGKLLPLLRETLDAAVAQGLDGRQLLDRLSASIESMQPGEAGQVAPLLSGLAQQFNRRISGLTVGAPVEGVALTTPGKEGIALTLPGKTDAVAPQGQLAELIQQQLRPQPAATQLPNTPEAAVLKGSLGENVSQSSQFGLDKALEQIQLQPQASEGRQSDLALLMAAFRRQRADGAHRASTDNARPDLPAVAGGGSAAAVTGTGVSSSVLPATSLQTPLGQAGWGEEMGERIQWMVSQKMQGAQVKLNPANLGPMEVRIQVQNDQASVQFTANHAMVREALEAALPRLRDMFEASGVELVDVDVSGQSFAEQQAADEDAGRSAWNGAADADDTTDRVLETEVASLGQAGRLDLFA